LLRGYQVLEEEFERAVEVPHGVDGHIHGHGVHDLIKVVRRCPLLYVADLPWGFKPVSRAIVIKPIVLESYPEEGSSLHFIPELSKMFADCATGSAMFCTYEGRVGRSLRPRGRSRAYAREQMVGAICFQKKKKK